MGYSRLNFLLAKPLGLVSFGGFGVIFFPRKNAIPYEKFSGKVQKNLYVVKGKEGNRMIKFCKQLQLKRTAATSSALGLPCGCELTSTSPSTL